LLGFLQETYAAAADLAKWDRNVLERANEGKTAWMRPKATWEEDRSLHCGIGVVRTTSRVIPVWPQPVLATRRQHSWTGRIV
jgi:hypothetical protein